MTVNRYAQETDLWLHRHAKSRRPPACDLPLRQNAEAAWQILSLDQVRSEYLGA